MPPQKKKKYSLNDNFQILIAVLAFPFVFSLIYIIITITLEILDSGVSGKISNNIKAGDDYLRNNNTLKALYHYDEALKIRKKQWIKLYKKIENDIKVRIGLSYYDLNEYNKSHDYFIMAISADPFIDYPSECLFKGREAFYTFQVNTIYNEILPGVAENEKEQFINFISKTKALIESIKIIENYRPDTLQTNHLLFNSNTKYDTLSGYFISLQMADYMYSAPIEVKVPAGVKEWRLYSAVGYPSTIDAGPQNSLLDDFLGNTCVFINPHEIGVIIVHVDNSYLDAFLLPPKSYICKSLSHLTDECDTCDNKTLKIIVLKKDRISEHQENLTLQSYHLLQIEDRNYIYDISGMTEYYINETVYH